MAWPNKQGDEQYLEEKWFGLWQLLVWLFGEYMPILLWLIGMVEQSILPLWLTVRIVTIYRFINYPLFLVFCIDYFVINIKEIL